MPLECKYVLTNPEARNITMVISSYHPGSLGRQHHLVLVGGEQLQISALTIGQQLAIRDAINLDTTTPTFAGFVHQSAQGPGHQLVPKTNAHQLAACEVGMANKVLQATNPGLVIVDAALAAGNDEAVNGGQVVRQLPRLGIPGLELQ